MNPDEARKTCNVRPDLDPNCLQQQKLSLADKELTSIWALTQQNLSSGFRTKRDSNQSGTSQLQSLARNLKLRYDTFQKSE